MERPDQPVTEELMSAWLDGALDSVLPGDERRAEREAVEAWLREHPEDAARVRLWDADRQALRQHLEPALADGVPERFRRLLEGAAAGHLAGASVAPAPPAAHRVVAAPGWALAAGAAGLLLAGVVIGGALGSAWQQRQTRLAAAAAAQRTPAPWVQRAAAAHAVYVPEPRHAVEVKAQEEHLSRWLTRRIQVPVKLFDLREQGFELVGGRLLPDGEGKSAQLMYENADKQRVTVYLRKPEAGTDAAFRFERSGELSLFYWVEAGAGYALVGPLPRERLLALAESIHHQGGSAAVIGAAASAPASNPTSAGREPRK